MELTNLSDEELMVMYQSGREDAFKALYERHSAKIYGFLRGRVWNDEKASELYQDVFLKIHRSKRLYNESLPALPWIFSIARSVLNDGLRLEHKFAREKDLVPAGDMPLSDGEQRPGIVGLIGQLSTDQNRAVQLRYVDEKTFEEIATALRTSPANVRKIISRAIAKLKAAAKTGDTP
jgi:RNA polymerase sigma factor (sigma-70 family)